jgi:HD-GYP domain-containing protein (c-di-GMP phosphodiesterase class II)
MTIKNIPHPEAKSAGEMLFRFYILLKIAKIHEPNNIIFQEQLRRFLASLDVFFQAQDRIDLQIRGNAIFINRTRVKFSYADYHVNQTIQAELGRRGIGTLTWLRGIDEAEAARVIILFSGSDQSSDAPFEDLETRLQAPEFSHVQITRAEIPDPETERNRKSARMYFLGISHLKTVGETEGGGTANFHLTKRWMQSIFNHIADDESFLYGLTNIKNYDEYTLNHSVNVCILSVALGRRLGLTHGELMELGLSAFLHDLGKVEIPDKILKKPGALNPEERAIMDRHARFGAERILQIQGLQGKSGRSVTVAFEHHFKADLAGGSPHRRKRHLNLYSRIVKITDFFDAVTTPRVYRRRAFTREEALNMMNHKAGTEFDPIILKAFITMIGAFPVGSLAILDTGEIGIVIESNPLAALSTRPRMKLISDRNGEKRDGDVVDLTDLDPVTRRFKRTIVHTLDPDKYGIRIADYFLSRAV